MKPIAFLFLFVGLCFARAPIRYNEYPAPTPYVSLDTFNINTVISSGSGGSTASDVVNIWKGTQSNRITVGNASTVLFTRTSNGAFNVCGDSLIKFNFFAKNRNQVTNLQSLTLYLFTGPSRYASFEIGSYGIRDSLFTKWGVWNQYYAPLKKFVLSSTFRCDSVNAVGVEPRALATTQDTLTIGEISAVPRRLNIGTIMITVDDENESFRKYGAPKLDSACLDYTMFVNGGRAGQATYSTQFQLDSMFFRSKCSRPDIARHLWQHDTATSLTTDSLIKSLIHSGDWIKQNGWCRPGQCAISAFAYPYGASSRTIDSAIKDYREIDFIRMARDYNQGETQQFNNRFSVRALATIGNAYDTASIKSYIDTVIANKGLGIFIVHKIDTVGCTEDATTWCKDKWTGVVNYLSAKIAAGTLQVVNYSHWMNPYGGGFTSRRRMGMGPN